MSNLTPTKNVIDTERSLLTLCRQASTVSNIVAGVIAVIVGYTSGVALVIQAAQAAGAGQAELGSWLLALGVGTGVTSIGLSLYYRMPVLTAWSTPGAAVLTASVAGFSMPEIIGGFVVCALLLLMTAVTGLFGAIVKRIPGSLASAMLAGILLNFGVSLFQTYTSAKLLFAVMLSIFLIGKAFSPRYTMLLVLIVGIAAVLITEPHRFGAITFSVTEPVWTTPEFSLAAITSISLPLFIVTMLSQNLPGVTVMQSNGYHPNINAVLGNIAGVNLLLTAFGGFALNLAAITAAICMSNEADPNKKYRFMASVSAGILYIITGIFGASIAAIFLAMPTEFITLLAGLALLSIITANLYSAVEHSEQREAATVTLLVTLSGISPLGLSSAVWGLLAGMTLVLIQQRKQ